MIGAPPKRRADSPGALPACCLRSTPALVFASHSSGGERGLAVEVASSSLPGNGFVRLPGYHRRGADPESALGRFQAPGGKVVGGTGIAPAWARAREFLRLVCLLFHHPPVAEAAGGRSTLELDGGLGRFLEIGLPAAAISAEGGGIVPSFTARRDGNLRPRSARRRLVRAEGVAPSWACARRLLGPARLLVPPRPHKKWIRHGDVRSTPPHTRGMRRCLRLAGMKVVETGGFAPPQPVRAPRLQRGAFAALPRLEKWGLGRESHPRPSPYEGAALTAAPPSRKSRGNGPARRRTSEPGDLLV